MSDNRCQTRNVRQTAPMSSVQLVGIVGSLRTGSANGAAARAAAERCTDGVTLTLHDVSDVPLYNGDEE
jgi:NAD(P)H-dependent FMN reductase